ncbi:Crp/Fnr family transcriptional regulator [Flavobacterium sp. SUN046]|uniref:Crp/Fnr family transcriptional regulator n=1 Tax=Flavobacterium sp. SUN046 TaxID=3002440 RepID=UPI002DBF56FA|nr:Crp/Fnr family transcriptional regulator [Flavobacterium sp. SUN046]MEC4048376.1 Crp/Fnr family transcriptional regulator [Flavobacterium sp. SUN046]
MTELELYISSYFGVIEPNELEIISSLFEVTTISKGDWFLKTGKQAEQLSFIKSGMLRIFVNTKDKEVTQWISTKGYFVTDLSSFVLDTPARWNIQALVDTKLFSISKENYKKIGDLVPKWHLLEKLFIAKCFTMLEDRIFSHLSMSAEERYDFFYVNNKELFHQVPLQYLASLLGMTPETFSRIRNKQLR